MRVSFGREALPATDSPQLPASLQLNRSTISPISQTWSVPSAGYRVGIQRRAQPAVITTASPTQPNVKPSVGVGPTFMVARSSGFGARR